MFGGEEAALVVDHQRLINPAQDVREILRSHELRPTGFDLVCYGGGNCRIGFSTH
jgi:hypothetical protein